MQISNIHVLIHVKKTHNSQQEKISLFDCPQFIGRNYKMSDNTKLAIAKCLCC